MNDPSEKIRKQRAWEQRRQQLANAWERFQESERILHVLRPVSSAPSPPPTDDQLLAWFQQLPAQ